MIMYQNFIESIVSEIDLRKYKIKASKFEKLVLLIANYEMEDLLREFAQEKDLVSFFADYMSIINKDERYYYKDRDPVTGEIKEIGVIGCLTVELMSMNYMKVFEFVPRVLDLKNIIREDNRRSQERLVKEFNIFLKNNADLLLGMKNVTDNYFKERVFITNKRVRGACLNLYLETLIFSKITDITNDDLTSIANIDECLSKVIINQDEKEFLGKIIKIMTRNDHDHLDNKDYLKKEMYFIEKRLYEYCINENHFMKNIADNLNEKMINNNYKLNLVDNLNNLEWVKVSFFKKKVEFLIDSGLMKKDEIKDAFQLTKVNNNKYIIKTDGKKISNILLTEKLYDFEDNDLINFYKIFFEANFIKAENIAFKAQDEPNSIGYNERKKKNREDLFSYEVIYDDNGSGIELEFLINMLVKDIEDLNDRHLYYVKFNGEMVSEWINNCRELFLATKIKNSDIKNDLCNNSISTRKKI